MPKEKRGSASISTIIITIFATIVIFTLAFFYYYLTIKPYPEDNFSETILPLNNIPSPVNSVPKVEEFATEVINFAVPASLPSEIKEGDCQINSIAEPYRPDAWKCVSNKVIYDPCFSIALNDLVYCKVKPSEEGSDFLIRLTNPLPPPVIPKNINANWAWYLVLEDGTELSPYIGARPMIDGEPAFYGSKITNGERAVIIGDLISGPVWTAQEKVLIQNGKNWVAKSSESVVVRVKKVWK